MILRKGNLTIRNAVPADAEQLCAWWNDGAIMAHAGFPDGLSETVDNIRASLTKDTDETNRRHIIEVDNKPIGEMNYRNKGYGVAEIGIKICDVSSQNKNVGTMVLSIFIDTLFTYYGYGKIVLDTNIDNTRAQHVYENKLGFIKVRTNENAWIDQRGVPQSSIDYELTKESWLKNRQSTVTDYQADVLYNDRFPLSNKYDAKWVFENEMGPQPLWLTEALTQSLNLSPGMRVLDLACGKGLTSVFLAREYGVQVYAVDFDEWGDMTSPEIRFGNAKAFNVDHLITPIKANAENLPFASNFFDAVICVNAYIYFGANETYLDYIAKFLRPGGRIAMVVPGYPKDITNGVPLYIKDFLGDELWTWKTFPWWRGLWEKSSCIALDVADTLKNGNDLWLRYDASLAASGLSRWPDETDIFRQDNGDYISFIRMVATKK